MGESFRPWHEMLASSIVCSAGAEIRVGEVIVAFLDWARSHTKDSTREQYEWYGQKLRADCGHNRALDLRPIDITNWTAAHGWTGAHEYNARRYAFRFFNWAKGEKLLPSNPLAGMPRPKPMPRQRALGEDEYLALIRASDSDLRPLLFALRRTGARPKELRDLVWPQVRGDRLVLPDHKTVGKTRRPRIIHLDPVMQRFFHARRRKAPPGDHVFANARGEPWSRNALRLRIARMKARLGLADDVCAYLIRHAFGTGAILNGVDVATVSELMGHSSTEVTTSVYIHLAEQTSHLQAAAALAAKAPPGPHAGRPRPRSVK